VFGDATKYNGEANEVVAVDKRMNVCLDGKSVALAKLPNTTRSLDCYSWLKFYFESAGDQMPNSNEIHLEPTPLRDIYEEYRNSRISAGCDPLSFTPFYDIWRTCFPNVKIREYKAVSGRNYLNSFVD